MDRNELRDYQAIAALAAARDLTDVEAERTAIDNRIAEIMRRTAMLPPLPPPGPEEPPGFTGVEGVEVGDDGRVTSGIAYG